MINTETLFRALVRGIFLGLVQGKGEFKRRAFTMIELVFVIVIVGIISVMIAPNFQGNNLRQAADQVVSHIRYTQHLAMMDNKFDVNDNKWFRKRWQIRFVQNITNGPANCNDEDYPNIWSYMIYSNENFACPGGICDNNPNNNELAKNPLDNTQLLSGGYNNNICPDNSYNSSDEQSMEAMRLADKYGIQNVTFSGGCRSTTRFVSFDYQGRPFNSFPTGSPYEIGSPGWHKLITSTCNIALTDGIDTITILIEPETGYTHIL